MRLDLDTRLSLGFAFGLFGLAFELIAAVFGVPVSSYLVGAFVSIILGTFGVGAFRGAQRDSDNEDDG